MDVWRLVATGLLVVAALGWLTFVALYAPTDWRHTREGRHLMLTRAGLVLLVGSWVGHRLWGPFPQWTWALIIAPTTYAAWQGVALLRRRQREARRDRAWARGNSGDRPSSEQ